MTSYAQARLKIDIKSQGLAIRREAPHRRSLVQIKTRKVALLWGGATLRVLICTGTYR